MTIQELKFITDENIDVEVVHFLREQGLDVFDIKEEGLYAISDREILKLSVQNSQIIISQDSDFGTLIFKEMADFYGIIYLRPGHHAAVVHLQTIRTLLQTNMDLSPPFLLVAENNDGKIKFRLREFGKK
ncbi:MAG: DUF5615 family PIN-like protein [Bacteroidota bacterium]